MKNKTKTIIVIAMTLSINTASAGFSLSRTIKNGKKAISKGAGGAVKVAAASLTGGLSVVIPDVKKETNKVAKKAEIETENLIENAEEAVDEVGKFTETQFKSTVNHVENTYDRVESGDLLGAVYHWSINPYVYTEKNALTSFQRSSGLKAVANYVIGSYTGPSGQACFAAWYTYRTTGELDETIKDAGLAFAQGYLSEKAWAAIK